MVLLAPRSHKETRRSQIDATHAGMCILTEKSEIGEYKTTFIERNKQACPLGVERDIISSLNLINCINSPEK